MLSIKEINLLQGQNEGLKKQNAELQKEIAELKENFEGQRNAYKKLNSMYEENCEYTGKLEQTLQEIKKIAEADVHIVGDEKLYYDVVEQILQKISEVINDRTTYRKK